jgi:hypothetical protein
MDHFERYLTIHMPQFGSENKPCFLMLQNTFTLKPFRVIHEGAVLVYESSRKTL